MTVLRAVLLLGILFAMLPGIALAGETDTFRFQPHPLEVQGQERRSFQVSPGPGGTVTDSVLLSNKTDEVRSFRIYAATATITEDGGVEIPPAHAEPQGIARWIELEQTEVGLLPGTEEIIRFSLTRPPDQPAAGSAAIVAEEVVREEGEPGIDVAYRIAILVEVGGDPAWLHVSEPQLELPIALVPGQGTARATIRNDTLESVEASVRWEVESLTGRIWQLENTTVSLEPGESKELTAQWSTAPRWGGVYRVNAEATWAAGSVSARSPRALYLPLWLLALGIAAVGVRGLREMWTRRHRGRTGPSEPTPDLDALRGRLIEAAVALHAAGRDAPLELRDATAAEAEAIAAQARRSPNGHDIERAARSLAVFSRNADDDASARQAAADFDTWFRQHRDDPRVKELVGP